MVDFLKLLILNRSVALASSFGKYRHMQIQRRLARRFPWLKQQQLNEFNRVGQEVSEFICNLVESEYRSLINDEGVFSYSEKWTDTIINIIKAKYPWLKKRVLWKIIQNELYYAMK